MTGKRIRHIGFQASLLVLIALVSLCQIGFPPLQRFQNGSDGGGSGEVGVHGSVNANHLQHAAILTSLNKTTIGDLVVPVVTSSFTTSITPATTSWNRTCDQNPYVDALKKTFNNKNKSAIELAAFAAISWLENGIHEDRRDANREIYLRQTHARFFPFKTTHQCKLTCIGGACHDDVSKIVCGVEQLEPQQQQISLPNNSTTNRCIVYSMGGNSLWAFELDLLEKTPCEIHTFDCTGDLSRFTVPLHSRLYFHHVCLGTKFEPAPTSPLLDDEGKCLTKILNETTGAVDQIQKCGETWTLLQMQQKLKHSRIDLFKVDIEGWEWLLFESWPELLDPVASSQMLLPMQILVEIHYRTKFPDLLALYNKKNPQDREFKFASDMVELKAHLVKMGYIVVSRQDNRFCRHCTELTLLRIFCPSGGVYGPSVGWDER